MKILILTMLFPNQKEPSKAPFNLEIAKNLTKKARVTVIAPVRAFPLGPAVKEYESISGIPVYHPRVFLPPKIGIFLHGLLYFKAIEKLAIKLLKEDSFDIILAPYLYPDGFAAVLLARKTGKPVVLEALGCDVNLLTKLILRRKLIKYACEHADMVISVNEDMKKTLCRLGIKDDKIRVIYNGVDKERFKPASRAISRKTVCLPDNKNVFLFAGSLEKVKGVFTLLVGWRSFIRGNPSGNLLVLVGSGKEKNRIEEFIRKEKLEDSVILAGDKPHDEIPVWMNASDFFCLPSIREGYPNVLIEALSCNKFVIATKVGGIPEIINSDKLGLLIEPADPDGLKSAFEEVLRMKTGQTSAGKEILTWEQSAAERYKLLEMILSQKG
jgi:teichuronic acid biosynthesis glycosyltransferase TuaC